MTLCSWVSVASYCFQPGTSRPVGRQHQPDLFESWLSNEELRSCISRLAFEVRIQTAVYTFTLSFPSLMCIDAILAMLSLVFYDVVCLLHFSSEIPTVSQKKPGIVIHPNQLAKDRFIQIQIFPNPKVSWVPSGDAKITARGGVFLFS